MNANNRLPALDKFINSYHPIRENSTYRYTVMVRHKGTVIALASDSDRRIWYTVLALSNPDIESPLDVHYWSPEPQELHFPNELKRIGRQPADLLTVTEVKNGEARDNFQSSTARLTADAPFQVLSDGHHVYLFRQTLGDGDGGDPLQDEHGNAVPFVRNTLLVDRFVFVDNALKPKTEIRFQRSRRKDRPLGRKDSLNARDMEGRPFVEPTGELSMIRNLSNGRFTVLLVPTAIPGVERWQIFAHNDEIAAVDAFNIERSQDGLFNLKGTVYYTSPDPQYQDAVFENKPGTCPFTGADLIPATSLQGHAGRALSPAKTGFIGNLETGELHDVACVSVDQMNPENKAPYATVAEALHHNNNYDPCGHCRPFDLEAVDQILAEPVATAGSYVELGRPKPEREVDLSGSLTIELWIKPAGFGQDKLLFGNVRGGAGTITIDDAGHLHFAYGTSGTDEPPFQEIVTPIPMLADRWTHIALVRNFETPSNGALQWVIDGIALGQQTAEYPGAASTDVPVLLGRDFHGLIDDLRVWTSARGRAEIEADMHCRLVGDEDHLVGYWRFDEVPEDAVLGIVDLTQNWPPAMLHGDAGLVASDAPIGVSPGVQRQNFAFKDRAITGGLSAIFYYQQEQTVTGYHSEAKPLKTSGRVMLTVATDAATQNQTDDPNAKLMAALDLGVSRFGQPAQVPQSISLKRIDPPAQPGSTNDVAAEIADLEARVSRLKRLKSLDTTIQTLEGEIAQLESEKSQLRSDIRKLDQRIDRIDEQLFMNCRIPPPPVIRLLAKGSHIEQKIEVGPEPPPVDCDKLQQTRASLLRQRSAKQRKLSQVDNQLRQKNAALENAVNTKKVIEGELDAMHPPQAYPPQADELAALQQALADKQAQLQRITPVMPVVNLDPTGLIAYGALLGFAATDDRPLLFESVNGDLNLYFRGVNGEFFAAYYDTQTERTLYRLPLDRKGDIYFSARHCGPDMDHTVIRVDDFIQNGQTQADLCRVSLINAGLEITETWDRVPRDVQQFAVVLNGKASKSPGEAGYYDYAANAGVNRPGWNLNQGSLLFFLYSPELDGDVVNTNPGQPITTGMNSPVAACRWLARTPGTTLRFDGNDDALAESDVNTAMRTFKAEGSFCIESWLKPEAADQDARVVHGPNYCLGLKATFAESAIEFMTEEQYMLLDRPVNLVEDEDPDDWMVWEWTIEAWVLFDPDHERGVAHLAGAGDGAPFAILYSSLPGENLYPVFGIVNKRHEFEGVGKPGKPLSGWHHVAATYRRHDVIFYLDGYSLGSIWARPEPEIVSLGKQYKYAFKGALDEVRVWRKARFSSKIIENKDRRVSAGEEGLLACWRFYEGAGLDYSGNGYHGSILGNPGNLQSPLSDTVFYAGTTNHCVQTKAAVITHQWNHLAAVYHQSYALHFNGRGDYLNCGTNQNLNLNKDLTIEIFFQIDAAETFSQPLGMLSKGGAGGGRDENIPYAVFLNQKQRLVFYFEDSEHKEHPFSPEFEFSPGVFYRVGVTRETVVSQVPATPPEVVPTVLRRERIRFVIAGGDGSGAPHVEEREYKGKAVGRSNEGLEVGRSYRHGEPIYFHGAISELRIWSTARDEEDLTSEIHGEEQGLVSWWRMQEGDGPMAEDAVGGNHATCGGARWIKNPDPRGSRLQLYQNGVPVSAQPISPPSLPNEGFRLGINFSGQMDELRLWKTPRTQEQIQDNLFRRLLGEKADLIAYYQFDAASGDRVPDHSGREQHLRLGSGEAHPTWTESTAPISFDTPQVRSAPAGIETDFNRHVRISVTPGAQEYGDMQYDAAGQLTGSMKRCYSVISNHQWQLITGFKVGDLILEWVAQVQSKPQLIGFIEGAPPVPSENLTQNPKGYANAASIELRQAESIIRSYSHAKDKGFDGSFSLVVKKGFKSETQVLIAPLTYTSIEQTKFVVAAKVAFELSKSSLDENVISYDTNKTRLAEMNLSGAWENEPDAFYCGRRYLPKNEGLALVRSDTQDIYALRLKHNNVLVAYRMLPNPDIPRDWNIISFPLNPLYVKQGTLDGKVGMQSNGAVQWDADYDHYHDSNGDEVKRNLPAYGEYSYFKPKEAYALRNKIDQEEQSLVSYYENIIIDPGKEPALDFEEEIEKLSSRNIYNTYVWTAAGGFFEESTQMMSTLQSMFGGVLKTKYSAGVSLKTDMTITKANLGFEFEALGSLHSKITETRRRDEKHGYGLDIGLNVERNLQKLEAGVPVFDANGDPVACEGKVDAYRFMTFFLQPSLDHFEAFVNKVVDQHWLWNSDDPDAVALREAIATQKEAKEEDKSLPWRVLHRVTFVSRVLPEVSVAQTATAEETTEKPVLEHILRQQGFSSSYELVKTLDAEVRHHAGGHESFSDALYTAVRKRMPHLTEKEAKEVVGHLYDYYQVFEE